MHPGKKTHAEVSAEPPARSSGGIETLVECHGVTVADLPKAPHSHLEQLIKPVRNPWEFERKASAH